MNPATLTTTDIARRFRIKLSKAHRLMRVIPHLKIGRDLITTEPWLAGWMAANVKNPPVPKNFDPLMQAAHQIAVHVVRELVESGFLGPVETRSQTPDGQIVNLPVGDVEKSGKWDSNVPVVAQPACASSAG